MMKLEQDTATKADMGLETNDFGDKSNTGHKVTANDGRHEKANR